MQEWLLEPNHMTFIHSGFKCEIIRHDFGHLNCYVYLPSNNIYHGLEELQLNDLLKSFTREHREITYADSEGELWKVGISFSHLNDYVPNIKDDEEKPAFMKELEAFLGYVSPSANEYRNIEQAINSVKALAEYLSKV